MTKQEYAAYVAAFEHGITGLEHISSGALPGCKACGLSEDCNEYERKLADEASFSWHRCEICNRPEGGDREPAHAVLDGDIVHLSICVDCVYFMEYGQLDDMTMMEIEESDQ